MRSNDMNTKESIIKNAKKIFARESLEGLSMRVLAAESKIALSVIYHYFPSKDDLLSELYKEVVDKFNQKAKDSQVGKTAKIKMRQFFEFCFENAHDISFCHKYFLSYRSRFRKNATGYLPLGLAEPLYDIVKQATKSKEIKTKDEYGDAKLLFFYIQGIILDYYPQLPSKDTQEQQVQKIMYRLENSMFA